METTLVLNKLYILSGVSGSGKSYFMKKLKESGLPEDAVIDVKRLSENILGIPKINGAYLGVKKNGFNNIIKEILDIRLSQNMTTFIDDSNLSEEVRREYVEIAKKHGMSYEILIFNKKNEEVITRSNISEKEFNKQLEKFKEISEFPYRVINFEKKYFLLPSLLNTSKVDIVGDTHGLLDELKLLLLKNDWNYNEVDKMFYHLDKERKLLFLGDMLDRGTQSVELLEVIKNTVENEQAVFLLGNHEEKLLSAYERYIDVGLFSFKSLSASQTLVDFLMLDKDKRIQLFKFLNNCPVRHAVWIDKDTGLVSFEEKNVFKFGFCHANNDFFDEKFMPRSLALYGSRAEDKDTDKRYNENYQKGINKHVLFRGHTNMTSEQSSIFSLEDDQAFRGNLILLSLDKLIGKLKDNNWETKYSFFEESVLKYKTEFNFDEYIKEKIMLLKEMNNLVEQGLATDGWRKDATGKKQPHEDGFKVFKYSKTVHFKRLWKSNPWLEKARGLVLDGAGNIVVHPFDKLYNFGEYDVGQSLPKNTKVQVIEKVNGYLGCISKHPFKNELLLSTTGSVASDAPFVEMIKDFVTSELNGKLLNFFKQNNVTLMFEVVHPKDPHIIEYSEKDYGLWLIGARRKELSAKPETENYLDNIAKKLDIKRPSWEEKTFGEVLESLQSSQLEGFMIRNAEDNEPLMKIKTNYYLVTKFVGRMGKNMVKMMFNHSEQFKEEKVDEEFYPIVDKIISKISEEDFNNMEQKERVLFVRDIVNETRNEFLDKPKLKIK